MLRGDSSDDNDYKDNDYRPVDVNKDTVVACLERLYGSFALSPSYSSVYIFLGSKKWENKNLQAKAATMANFLKAVEEGKHNGRFEAGWMSESVDICFLLDCTGSMSKWIAA